MMPTGRQDRAGAFDLHVLGAFAVLRNGKRVALPPSRKTRALLAYLAVVDRPQPRERLCRMFWNVPDDPRGALRWSLSKIRQIVNIDGRDVLVTDRNGVALRGQSIALDLQQIKEMLQHHLPSIGTSKLQDVAGLFKGGFLEDLSLPRCPEFEAWRVSQVNEVDLLKARLLRTLIDQLATEPSRALPYAHALQAIDPENSGLAVEVKALADLALEQAVKAPQPRAGRIRDEVRRSAAANPQASAPAESTLIDDERRHITVLSIEIVSPLHAFASVDPQLILRQLDPLFESALGIIELHGGIVSAYGNSGITAVFGTSVASKHHAVAACRAALVVKSTVESQSEGNVRVRAGLDSGEVIVRHRGVSQRIEVTGAAVRTAARLAHSLRRGVLAVTDRTQVAAGGLMELGLLSRSEFPRFDRAEQVYELLRERPAT